MLSLAKATFAVVAVSECLTPASKHFEADPTVSPFSFFN
jgi:hypothetical protein